MIAALLAKAGAVPLFAHFAKVSLLGIGGAITLVPEIHRILVEQYQWLDDAQFTAAIAIAQAAPGPNILFAAVLGLQVSGIGGALAALSGIMLPSSVLALVVAKWGESNQQTLAMRAFRAGMAPISLALLLATGWVLSAAPPNWGSMLLTALAAALVWRTRIHLLWLIGAGALAGILGWV